MQLYPILVVAIILAADSGLGLAREEPPGALTAWFVAWTPVLAILLLAAVIIWRCRRQLERGRVQPMLSRTDRALLLARWLLLANHAAAAVVCGWHEVVRSLTGNLIAIDEVIAMLPPLLGAAGLWWLYYPIERRLREALLIRQLDVGQPVHPMPTRGRYVLQQVRMQLLLLFVPVVIILAAVETVRWAAALLDQRTDLVLPPWSVESATLLAGLLVFIFSPALARLVLSVTPLPNGEVRDDLEEICRRHGVRVRRMLLWHTDGSMINAAVMGLIGPLRYVLLTDALLETMGRNQVRAVMAHEIGHVRRHHMPWLALSLMATLVLGGLIVTPAVLLAPTIEEDWGPQARLWGDGLATAAAAALALLAFGWISRRYERQPDTFAVQHLSADPPDDESDGPPDGRVSDESVAAMTGALSTIARLNSVDPDRRSWRHGSISWRCRYLASITGAPVERLPIDRLVGRLKLAAVLTLVVGLGATMVLEQILPHVLPSTTDVPTMSEPTGEARREPSDGGGAP